MSRNPRAGKQDAPETNHRPFDVLSPTHALAIDRSLNKMVSEQSAHRVITRHADEMCITVCYGMGPAPPCSPEGLKKCARSVP